MRKLIAAMNFTLDGYCDHTAGIADEELHQHYADLIRDAGTLIYGRITYQLMEYWRGVLENPTGEAATDDFAAAIDRAPKLVFSRTLKALNWKSARLATRSLEEEVRALKESEGGTIYACSPSMIVALTNLNLIDEYQLCLHPVIAGGGLPLFQPIREKITLKLTGTKTFGSGALVLYYRAPKTD